MFLADGVLSPLSSGASPLEAFAGAAVGIMVLFLLLGVAIWVYIALAHMAIARRAGQNDSISGLSWVLGFGPLLIAYILSGMHWWPWLLMLITFLLLYLGFALVLFSPVLGVLFIILSVIGFLVFGVYSIIWMCKMFKAVGRSIWFALLLVILTVVGYPLAFLGAYIQIFVLSLIGLLIVLAAGILYLVFIGIAAWGSRGQARAPAAAKPAARKK
ncbi:hypothetical protein A3K73_05685 [Candidatus Pacearchaeota archaeon RBG_13_36_9]|nr:MAG: hypothetical protein A3K73_05685 [Candidatus Pacearchaeota archaeon RBG_13_36_9]